MFRHQGPVGEECMGGENEWGPHSWQAGALPRCAARCSHYLRAHMRRTFLTFVTVLALSAVVAFQLHLAVGASAERSRLQRQLALANEDNERLRGIVVAEQKAR